MAGERIISKIVTSQINRAKQDIGKWRTALSSAENILNPNRVNLLTIYKDVVLDSHLKSVMKTIHSEIKASPAYVKDAKGNIIEKALKKQWYYKFLKAAIDAEFYGFSVIQFNEPDKPTNNFKLIDIIPREYVTPEWNVIKTNINQSSPEGGIFYNDPPYNENTIYLGGEDELGLLNNACPLAIWKKHSMGAWSQFSEMFGMPFRAGFTDIHDPERREQMVNMLTKMGDAAFAVLDKDDKIDFVTSQTGDAHKVYSEFIKLLNSEMSKLMLGQTMTTDDGSSRSQAEVHERVMQTYINAIKIYLDMAFNEKLMPILNRYGFMPTGAVFGFETTQTLTVEEKLKALDILLKYFDISPEFINSFINVEVAGKGGTPTNFQELKNSINEYYKVQ